MNEFKVKDMKGLKNVAKALNFGGHGRIIIDGRFTVDESVVFTAPVHLVGAPGSHLKIKSNLYNPFIWKGRKTNPYSLNVTSSYTESFSTDAPIKRGDWVIMYSDDQIPVKPHWGYGNGQFPMELHQVNHVASDGAGVNDLIIDHMRTNAKLMISRPLENIVVRDLTISTDGSSGQKYYSTVLKFVDCTNVLVENVRLERDGPGAIWAADSSNVRIQGLHFEGTQSPEGVYGVIAGVVNGMLICDSTISGSRHAFTTTSGKSVGRNRYGTPLNVVLDNCVVNVPTKFELNKTRAGLDTHAEGYGVVFSNCVINIGQKTVNVGAQTRSRNTVFKNLVVRGGRFSKGIRTYASDAEIKGCVFDNMWYAISTHADRCSIVGNSFRNTTSSPIWLSLGSGHIIKYNDFRNCSYRPSRNPDLTAPFITMGPNLGDNHQIDL